MSWEYCCPKCKTNLNPGTAIILKASCGDAKCLIGMNPQPGKYDIYLPPKVDCEDGCKWDFYCPICQENLKNDEDPHLCELELVLEGDNLRILFSRIAGEHATFILHEDMLKERFGKDSERYDPFRELKQSARF